MAVKFLESERESFRELPRFRELLESLSHTARTGHIAAACEVGGDMRNGSKGEAKFRYGFRVAERPGKKKSGGADAGSMRKYGMSTKDEVQ